MKQTKQPRAAAKKTPTHAKKRPTRSPGAGLPAQSARTKPVTPEPASASVAANSVHLLPDLKPVSPAQPFDAKLWAAKSAKTKRSRTRDGALTPETAARAKNPIDDAAKKTRQLVPLSTDWKGILDQLLADPAYTPGPAIEALELDDPVRILSSMQFHFRREAMEPLRRGIRYFGKVPYPTGWSSSDPQSSPSPAKLFRPVACPEGPGGNHRFCLAWLEGSAFRCVAPGETDPREDDADHTLAAIARLVDFDFTLDLLQLTGDIASTAATASEASRNGRPGVSKPYLQQLAAQIAELAGGDGPEASESLKAFACGILYCRKIAYPECEQQDGRTLLGRETITFSVVLHALCRHGVNTPRKELLARLGCINAADFKKDSRKDALFDPDHSRHTPRFSFASFDKAYKKAIAWLKTKAPGDHTDAFHPLLENVVKPHIARHVKTQGQQKRQRNVKKKLDLYGKAEQQQAAERNREAQAEREQGIEQAKRARLKQQNGKAELAVKNMGGLPGPR